MNLILAQRLSDLAVEYANHRKQFWENKRAIRAVHDDAEGYIDLGPYRSRYLNGDVTDDPECCIVWRGWLHAVDECQAWDDEERDDEDCAFRSMAILLDQRNAIKADGAKIRNKLRMIGDQILRAAK